MLGVSVAAAYTDDMWRDTSYNPRAQQDSYTKTNASLRIYPNDRSWEVAIIGNNISDEITASTCASGPFDHAAGLIPNPSGLAINPIIPGGADQALCFAEPGREIWVRATYFWGN